ncbi:NAC domain-containing protein 1 [Raphanus sativus]|uniref:NAC domain-containing protein 1 n=1 Tax=Raphanus sativus TaxID=3726 RepID=A0A6J0JNQ1_RAPSA|nr:NAC domain-containing protein 1 [Raphanus sativus]KAJ4914661.1 NAC domain-containing protein 1 [Raphanus sativus]
MGEKPGFEFRPYDEELVGYYLRHKILGNDSLVDGVIKEIKICSFDPWDLRFQSKIKSRDVVWYFLSRREENVGSRQSRRTPSGFWKLTGDPVDVNDRWGHLSGFRGKIGYKRVLTFGKGKSSSSKSDWVMHELHYTLLPEHKRTYVICRLEYKGDDMNILSANPTYPIPTFAPTMANSASSVVDQSSNGNSGYYNTLSEYDSAYQGHQFNGNYETQPSFQGYTEYLNSTSEYDLANGSHWFSNLQQQAPYSAPYQDDSDLWKQVVQENWTSLVDERTYMREDSSHYRPKTPVTGIFPDDSSDDDDTDSTIGRDTWSSTDSVGSKDVQYHTPKDDTPSLSSVVPLHNPEPQEQPKHLELQLQGKEKKSECEWKMAEDSTKKVPSTTAVKQSWIVLEEMSQRNSRWIHLKNMIIGFLLFLSIIGWIILVG